MKNGSSAPLMLLNKTYNSIRIRAEIHPRMKLSNVIFLSNISVLNIFYQMQKYFKKRS